MYPNIQLSKPSLVLAWMSYLLADTLLIGASGFRNLRTKWRSPLLRAVENSDFAAVELLLQHGARPSFVERLPQSPLSMARMTRDGTVIRMLQSSDGILRSWWQLKAEMMCLFIMTVVIFTVGRYVFDKYNL